MGCFNEEVKQHKRARLNVAFLRCPFLSMSRHTPVTKLTNAHVSSPSTKKLLKSMLYSISGTSRQRLTSKFGSTKGKTYLLGYDEETDEWTLQSGFDGDELLTRPSIELVTVDSAIAKKAEQRIESCEHCHPADAEIPFDWLLAEVTGKRGPYEFMLSEPARCPNCKHEITEKTLVEPK